jgi:maltose-binding protein MalE
MNQLVAMDWIKEMTSPEAALKMWAEAKQLPTLLPSLKSQAIRGDVNAKSYEWLLDHAVVMPAHPEISKKLSGMLPELQKLQKGEYDVKTFAGQMTKLWVPTKK